MYIRLGLLLLIGFAVVHGVYQTPKCNPEIVSNILKYWKRHGVPKEYFKEVGLKWTVLTTTANGAYKDVKCATYTPLGDGIVSVNIDGKEQNITTTYTHDGYLHIAEDTDHHYVVLSDNSVIAGYRCSDEGPDNCQEEPVAGLTISPHATKSDITRAKRVQDSLGFKLTKYFTC